MPTPPDDMLLNKTAVIERCISYQEMDQSVLRWVVEAGHHDWILLGETLGVSIRP